MTSKMQLHFYTQRCCKQIAAVLVTTTQTQLQTAYSRLIVICISMQSTASCKQQEALLKTKSLGFVHRLGNEPDVSVPLDQCQL